ncbi:MAG: hydroxyacylglutathione hydrolase [Methanomassiliicoccales archaeon PtaB.Bin134]|jgi:glyoxylase-like metal-dependent hydrolase (beta-lactamase superfamily II)|nr:MAG: hydroxyacylglutathione hydrolase [Methanomassiliicoccales archaeon PtaB.Bin134]
MDFDSNIYLLTGEDPILVDVGTGMHHQDVLKWLSYTVKRNKVRRIVLTHRHYDHTGGAAGMAKELGAEVLMHADDSPAVRQGDPRQTLAYMFGVPGHPVEVTDLVDGQVLSTGSSNFQVVHTPGHTSGSISLWEKDKGILLSGDTVFVGGVGRWDLPSGNFEQLVGSVKKLLSLAPKEIYPGHGDFSQNGAEGIILEALNYLGES